MDQPRKERRSDDSSSRERRFHGRRRNDQVALKKEIDSLACDRKYWKAQKMQNLGKLFCNDGKV